MEQTHTHTLSLSHTHTHTTACVSRGWDDLFCSASETLPSLHPPLSLHTRHTLTHTLTHTHTHTHTHPPPHWSIAHNFNSILMCTAVPSDIDVRWNSSAHEYRIEL